MLRLIRLVVLVRLIVGATPGSTERVTLSACEIGRGLDDGEGLMGLSRARHAAGARHVVASLWTVDDDATAALTARFYRNVWERALSLDDALRAARWTRRTRAGL
jgi:CHAT domain-containing protein